MENESTFVAPEGVYSVTDEHKPNQAQSVAAGAGPHLYTARISSTIIRYPTTKPSGGSQAFAQLLGGGKNEQKKDKAEKTGKEKEDGTSLSSNDSPDDSEQLASSSQENTNASVPHEPHMLFSAQPAAGKKKTAARPKHNLKTTSSTFITRLQNAEGMTKILQSKTGDVTFLFYNVAKSIVWIEAGPKAKVIPVISAPQRVSSHLGTFDQNNIFYPSHLP
jgi:hypothetical protein